MTGFTPIEEAIMGRRRGARHMATDATARKSMGLRLLAFFASLSLMLIGFGALGASPATAESEGDGTYTPNCAKGYEFDHDTSMCVKDPLVEKTAPTYAGNCDVVDDDAEALAWGPWVFDVTTGIQEPGTFRG
jgi:hypothetical protein